MYRAWIFIGAIVALVAAWFAVCKILYSAKRISANRYGYLARVFPMRFLKYLLLVIAAFAILMPFMYALLLGFKTGDDVFRQSPIPEKFVFTNYVEIFRDGDIRLLSGILNSFAYALPPCIVGVLSSTMAAYALSRLHFKGRDKIFGLLFATICIPGVITLIPSYIMFAKLYNWTDTPLPLIIPGMCGSVTVIFFLRQFLLGLPRELDEAGIIDGLNKGGVFFYIIMPLSWPAMLAQFLLAFNGGYNDFMGPLMYIGSNKQLYTIQLTVYSMYSSNVKQIEKVMATCTVALIPSIVLFAFAQKYFLGSAVSADSIKG
ncbi:MAG: carbohydrate ABC transporter permease [Clostridia bacterium]|nr:carbohydrate ABC transporter permease [Clostridia bacterium]